MCCNVAVILLYNVIQSSLNSGSVQIEILLTTRRIFAVILTMIPTANDTKRLSSLNHCLRTISYHCHHDRHFDKTFFRKKFMKVHFLNFSYDHKDIQILIMRISIIMKFSEPFRLKTNISLQYDSKRENLARNGTSKISKKIG